MEIKVFETTDYDLFKKLKGNRDVYSVNKITQSIKKVGYIPSPICVNEKMEIIDGQNRLEALKKLGMPVQYYVVKGIGVEEARQMNIGRRNWSQLDYVKSYAAEGRAEYVAFLNLYEEHGEYAIQELWGICKGRILTSGWEVNDIKNGTLDLTNDDIEKGKNLIALLSLIRPSLDKLVGSKRMAITAFAWILSHPKADRHRIVKVVNSKYPLFIPVVSAESILKDFGNHYNKGLTASKQILFDVDYRLQIAKEK